MSNTLIRPKVSVVSKSNIRYVGVLESMDNDNLSITLSKAHIHGTEKRVCAKFVPPLPDAFDKLIVGHFRSIIVIDSADAIDNVLPNNSVNVKQNNLPTTTVEGDIQNKLAIAKLNDSQDSDEDLIPNSDESCQEFRRYATDSDDQDPDELWMDDSDWIPESDEFSEQEWSDEEDSDEFWTDDSCEEMWSTESSVDQSSCQPEDAKSEQLNEIGLVRDRFHRLRCLLLKISFRKTFIRKMEKHQKKGQEKAERMHKIQLKACKQKLNLLESERDDAFARRGDETVEQVFHKYQKQLDDCRQDIEELEDTHRQHLDSMNLKHKEELDLIRADVQKWTLNSIDMMKKIFDRHDKVCEARKA